MILGIDTSIGTAVAVVDLDGTVRAEATSADPRGHAEVIGDLIARALTEAGAASADITHVAAGMGPGPFTGLRVGIAAARAFAIGRGIPVVPIVSHDAAALAAAAHDRTQDSSAKGDTAVPAGGQTPSDAAPFVVVTDARRREVAYSVYAPGPWPVRIEGPALAAKGTEVAIESLELDAEGLALDDEALTTSISAADLARIAARRIATGESDATASAPVYLRAPDVSVPAARKRVGA